nr:MAG: putative glycoprotein 2 [Wufeng rodent arterivirus 1]
MALKYSHYIWLSLFVGFYHTCHSSENRTCFYFPTPVGYSDTIHIGLSLCVPQRPWFHELPVPHEKRRDYEDRVIYPDLRHCGNNMSVHFRSSLQTFTISGHGEVPVSTEVIKLHRDLAVVAFTLLATGYPHVFSLPSNATPHIRVFNDAICIYNASLKFGYYIQGDEPIVNSTITLHGKTFFFLKWIRPLFNSLCSLSAAYWMRKYVVAATTRG